jgi:acyl carrier protein
MEMEEWDSMAILGFIALADEQLGAEVDPQAAAEAKSMGELVQLVRSHLASA